MKPIWDARQRDISLSDRRSRRSPATSIAPASDRSMPPSRLSSVVLPDPDGPITATKSPRGMARLRPSKMVIVSLPLVKRLLRSTMSIIGSIGSAGDNMGLAPRPLRGIRPRRGGRAVVQECHLDRHVRQNACIFHVHADTHLD